MVNTNFSHTSSIDSATLQMWPARFRRKRYLYRINVLIPNPGIFILTERDEFKAGLSEYHLHRRLEYGLRRNKGVMQRLCAREGSIFKLLYKQGAFRKIEERYTEAVTMLKRAL